MPKLSLQNQFTNIEDLSGDVYIFGRVSTSTQARRDNGQALANQIKRVEHQAKELGLNIVDRISGIETGVMADLRPMFDELVEHVRQQHASILTIDRTRFLRAKRGQDCEPVYAERLALHKLTKGVTLGVAIPPCASLDEIHIEKSRLGKELKNAFGGRPLKRIRFMTLLTLLHLRGGDGEEPMGLTKIAKTKFAMSHGLRPTWLKSLFNTEIDPANRPRLGVVRLVDMGRSDEYSSYPTAEQMFRGLVRKGEDKEFLSRCPYVIDDREELNAAQQASLKQRGYMAK